MKQALSMATKRPPPNWAKLLAPAVVGGAAAGPAAAAAPSPPLLQVQEKQLARLVSSIITYIINPLC